MRNTDFNIRKAALASEAISPKLFYCHLFKGSASYERGHELQHRHVRNYEIEFFLSGGGGMWINDLYYAVQKGDIIFRKPGDYTQAVMPYDCYCIFFTFVDSSKPSAESYDIYAETDFEALFSNEIIQSIPIHFHPIGGDKYYNLFDSIFKDFINPSPCSQLLIKSSILQIISLIHQDYSSPLGHSIGLRHQNYSAVHEIVEFIGEHTEEKLSLEMLSKKANLSPSHFHKLFKKALGINLNEYIVKTRLEKSKEMLLKTNDAIWEIAFKCGFDSLSYFSYIFKRKIGISPLEFRNRYDLYRYRG